MNEKQVNLTEGQRKALKRIYKLYFQSKLDGQVFDTILDGRSARSLVKAGLARITCTTNYCAKYAITDEGIALAAEIFGTIANSRWEQPKLKGQDGIVCVRIDRLRSNLNAIDYDSPHPKIGKMQDLYFAYTDRVQKYFWDRRN